MGWWKSRALLCDCLLLLALPLALHAPDLLGFIDSNPQIPGSGLWTGVLPGLVPGHGGYLDPNSAWTAQALGQVAADHWLAGRVPWWNPYSGVGAPLAAEMQPAALFLPFILLMHFRHGWLWLHMIWQGFAGIGTLLLLRQLSLSRAACLIGAVLYACNGTFAWFSHGPERVAAFLPWLLLGVEMCRTGPRGAAVLSAALACSLYAGWPETAFLNGLLTAAWTLFRFGVDARRWRFAAHVAAGLAAGMGMAAPAVWPFLRYIATADTGGHARMAYAAVPGPGLAALLLPYANGPIVSMGEVTRVLWGTAGGYVGIAATTLALAGAFGGPKHRPARLLLAAWLVLAVARAGGVAPVIWLSNLIPFMARDAVYRYIVPSLGMAAAVLAALAIDDWQTNPARRRAVGAGLCGVALIGGALLLCRPIAVQLWTNPLYRASFGLSAAWAFALCVALGSLIARHATRGTLAAAALLVVADCAGGYALARLGTPRGGTYRPDAARYLQKQAGLTRIVNLGGGLSLNEAAAFGVAAVDETMLPAPRLWSDFTRHVLQADPISLDYWTDGPARLARDGPALRELGVGFIVSGQGMGPAHQLGTSDPAGARRAAILGNGVALAGALPAGLAGQTPFSHLGVDIGTFAGHADGRITLALTWSGGHAQGSADLAGAADNAPVDIALNAPVPPAVALHWRLTQSGSTSPVAIWIYDATGAPRFSGVMRWPGFAPELVFIGGGKEIYRLPGAAPYWDAPGCAVKAVGRERAETDCARAGTVLRRELFFAGWSASVNGIEVPIRQDGLFQRIDLPAGRGAIRFSYAPPGIVWAAVAGLAGLAGSLALGFARSSPITSKTVRRAD